MEGINRLEKESHFGRLLGTIREIIQTTNETPTETFEPLIAQARSDFSSILHDVYNQLTDDVLQYSRDYTIEFRSTPTPTGTSINIVVSSKSFNNSCNLSIKSIQESSMHLALTVTRGSSSSLYESTTGTALEKQLEKHIQTIAQTFVPGAGTPKAS